MSTWIRDIHSSVHGGIATGTHGFEISIAGFLSELSVTMSAGFQGPMNIVILKIKKTEMIL